MADYAITKRAHGRGHIYEIDGQRVPRVTTILDTIIAKGGAFRSWLQRDAIQRFQKLLLEHPEGDWSTQAPGDILKWALPVRTPLDRGGEVHRALESGDLDYRHYHAEVQPYIRAAARFMAEEAPEVESVETIIGSKSLSYAGTCDARGSLGGKRAIWDYKTANRAGSEPYLQYHLQLAAYELAWQEMGYEPTERQLVIMLYPDGEYAKFSSIARPHDWQEAMSWYERVVDLSQQMSAR